MALVVLDKAKQEYLSSMVENGILEKLGPNPPQSMRDAAKVAGQCFAKTVKTRDLARLAISRI